MPSMPKHAHSSSIRPETTPLYATSVYTFPSLADVAAYYEHNFDGAYVYRRNGHPNEAPVEEWLCQLEGGEAAALCSSGMAAISQACMAFLKPGDHVLATRHFYGGSYALFEQILRPWGIDIDYADLDSVEALADSVKPNTRLIFVETIANPLLQVTDLAMVGAFAKERAINWFVDNTFATPLLAKPLAYGATLSIHSLTKYLNGHSDVIGGVVVGSAEAVARVRKFSVTFGGTLGPFDAWQTERGLQTFHLRFPAQCHNALRLAERLANHPAVANVYYPGLPNHASHQAAKRILEGGFGAMVTISLKGGYDAADTVVRACRLIQFAPSLGGVHTTLSHPGLTSHRAYSETERAALGITDGMLRISIGAETYERIEEDFLNALNALDATVSSSNQV